MKNEEKLAADLTTGLEELLKMHNPEELRTLCVTLAFESSGNKKSQISRILTSIKGSEETGCRKVLNAVWDGIVIEYLRGDR